MKKRLYEEYMNICEAEDKIYENIFDFFKENPKPSDKEVHSLAEKLGLDEHKFETYIYEILGSFIGAGRAKEKNVSESDFAPDELKKGIEIEMEHTTLPIIAKRIALDHLAEFSDYYLGEDGLIAMEKKLEKIKNKS